MAVSGIFTLIAIAVAAEGFAQETWSMEQCMVYAADHASSVIQTPVDIAGCVNVTTIGFLLFILIVMGFTSGIVPALMLSSVKPVDAMKGG